MLNEPELEYCPVSGLLIIRDPKWQNCFISELYKVDFCFIGRRILIITHHGDSQYQDIDRLYELREQFLTESFARFGVTSQIVEMRDYGDVVGMPSKPTRARQLEYFFDHRSQTLGIIVFNMTLMLRSIIRMGLTLSRAPFPFEIEKDYSSAIKRALSWVEVNRDKARHIVMELKEWSQNWGELSVTVGQIGNRILLTRPKGWMHMHHVDATIKFYRQLRKHLFSMGEPYIQIADYTDLKGADIGVRFRLAKAYHRLNKETNAPLALILIAASPILKTTFSMVKRWIGGVNHCRNLDEALEVSERLFNDKKGRLDLTARNDPKDIYGTYIQEMIEYVASFGWDDALRQSPNIYERHPFRGLYDALDLVRYDIEELLKCNQEAKQELAEKEAYYRGLYEMTADAIILFDGRDGSPVDANPAALSLLGCSDLAKFRSIAWWRFLAGGDQDDPLFRAVVTELSQNGGRRIDWNLRSLSERFFSADIQLSAIMGRGFPVVMAVIRDMTEQRRIEEEIRSARDAAQNANEAKNEFLANMSHEVRTPLNGILGLTEILLEDESEAQKIDHLKDIKKSGESLLEIVSEILDFSRIETGRIQIEKMEFDIAGLVRRVIRMFSVKCHERHLEMICDFDQGIVNTCYGDPVKIRQILVNLIGNAVKFTEKGFVLLKVRSLSEGNEKQGLRFVVSDTGIGIPQDHINMIFDRFYQVDSSMHRSQGGTGLGLSICKRLVKAMGGSISVSSKTGEGSHFEVELPIDFLKTKSFISSQEFGKFTILVYESHPCARAILLEYFHSFGQTVIECSNADDFFRSLDSEYSRLDGIVLSQKNDDGILGSLQVFFDQKGGNKIPLLLLSHGRSLRLKGKLVALGVNETVLKPIFPNELANWLLSIKKDPIIVEQKAELSSPVLYHDKPFKILLAEDNEINQKMLCRLLKKKGWQVQLARDGQEAVDMFFAKGADVVLMDLQMPVMDGYQAALNIRSAEKGGNSRVPIIALTAHAQTTHMEKSFASGMDAYLTKPVSTQALYGLLERFFSEGR